MPSTQGPTASALELALAARLRAEIAEHKVSKTKLAERVGVHRTHLSRVINGHVHIDVNLLAALCEAMDLDVVEIVAEASAQARERERSQAPESAHDALLVQLDEQASPVRTTPRAVRTGAYGPNVA